MIYVNGDSHSAGADIVEGLNFANDDRHMLIYGKKPHPKLIPLTFGYKFAQHKNQPLYCDAISGSSNDRILRTSKQFVSKKTDCFVLIGWSTWEREEWLDGETFVQITASGIDSVPEDMVKDYMSWVIRQDNNELRRKEDYWHDTIWKFHCELQQNNVKHLFFNTYSHFGNIENRKDWNGSYIDPYNPNETYYNYLKHSGISPVFNYHYGEDGHAKWSKRLINFISENT